jgi:hypothetical protein
VGSHGERLDSYQQLWGGLVWKAILQGRKLFNK